MAQQNLRPRWTQSNPVGTLDSEPVVTLAPRRIHAMCVLACRSDGRWRRRSPLRLTSPASCATAPAHRCPAPKSDCDVGADGVARTKTDAEGGSPAGAGARHVPADCAGGSLRRVASHADGGGRGPAAARDRHPSGGPSRGSHGDGVARDRRGRCASPASRSTSSTRARSPPASRPSSRRRSKGEAGVHLQRTSPTMAGIFVRGLTGNKVNIFVDGVRYSNGAQRGGVNTFLDLIEPEWLETIEVLRGPSSAQYGSDALGGSVQFSLARTRARRRGWTAVARVLGRRRRHRASHRRRPRVRGLHGQGRGPDGQHRRAQGRPVPSGRWHRLARGGHALSSASRRRAHGRAPAGHRVRAVRRRRCERTGSRMRGRTSPPVTCGRTRTAGSATTSSSAATAT